MYFVCVDADVDVDAASAEAECRDEFPPKRRFASPSSYDSLADSLLLPMPARRLSTMDLEDRIAPNMIQFGELIGEGR